MKRVGKEVVRLSRITHRSRTTSRHIFADGFCLLLPTSLKRIPKARIYKSLRTPAYRVDRRVNGLIRPRFRVPVSESGNSQLMMPILINALIMNSVGRGHTGIRPPQAAAGATSVGLWLLISNRAWCPARSLVPEVALGREWARISLNDLGNGGVPPSQEQTWRATSLAATLISSKSIFRSNPITNAAVKASPAPTVSCTRTGHTRHSDQRPRW